IMADPLSVLYVDDEPDLLEIGRIFLEESGDFTVTTAMRASDALRLLEQEKFDVIISDYQMPGMDGIQFLIEVRTKFGSVPFILFTGKGREEVVIQAINNGADFYIQKAGELKAQFAELVHKIKQAALRNKAENSLRRSEEKYRHLIEHSNEAILVAQDGMLKLVNHRTTDFTGYSEQELLSMQFSAFIHPEDRAMVVERYQKRLKGEEGPSRYSFRLSTKDGSTRWIELSVVLVDWDGRPATLNFLTDITERKRADDSLREEQQFSKLMLDSLPGIFYLYTYPENRMVRWNKQHETLLGYTAEEIKGKLGTDLHLPEYKGAVLKAIDEVMEKGQNSVESTLMAKDGHQIPFFFTGVRFETPDQLYFMGIGIDITEHKVAEAALLKKTEELNTSYEEIAATGEELRQNLDELTRQEEALRESKRELADIIEFLPDATFVIDRQAIVIAWNRAMEELTGIRAEDMLGKGNYEYAIPFYGERRPILIDLVMIQDQDVLNKYSSVQKEGDSLTAETEMAHLGGKNLFLWGKAILIKNSHGEVVGAIESIRDITAWKHAEKKLVFTQEHLKEAHRIAGIGTWDWVIETDTVTWSEELCTIAGRAPSLPAPTYAELPQIYTPASWERLSAAVTNALNTGEPYNLELELIRPDGSIRCTYAFGGVIRDTKGTITGLHGMLQDITERKQAEEALKKREEKYRQLVELAQEGIWAIDAIGNTTYVNQQMAKILGYTAEEMLGVHPFSFMDDAGKIIAAENMERRRQGITEDHEFEFITKGGNRIYAHLSTSPIIDEKGVYLGALAVVTDITERKNAEVALKTEKQRLANIIEGTRAGTWEWNVQTGETIFNEQWAEITGYTLSELSPISIKTWMNYAHPDDLQKSGELLEQHFLQKSEWYECECRMKHKNGDWVWVLDRGKVASWTKDGKPLWMYGTHQDITERKVAEEALLLEKNYSDRLFDAPYDTVFLFEPSTGKPIRWNKRFSEVSGYTDNEIAGMKAPREFYDTADLNKATEAMVRNYTENVTVELSLVTKQGAHIPFEYSATPIETTDGKTLLLSIGRNITERKVAESAITESFAIFKTVMDSLDALVYVSDMKTYEVLFINQYGKEIFGDITGKICWKSIQVDQNGPCPFCTNEKIIDLDGNPAGILVWEFKNTINRHWYECHDSAIRWTDGRIVRIEIASDIT
ncbi:MAG: PAS domain S-box protein, partial [Methanoregula sp.]|nr:PAS domain S-box protein [Methanoregula sp.]